MHKAGVPLFHAVLGMVALAGVTATAGSFNSDFSNPNQTGFTLTSNNATRPDSTIFEPVITDGHLVLTWNENSQQGSIIFDDLDGGAAIDSFTATFKLKIGPGSGNAADGFSFVFGPDLTPTSNFGEEGVGAGIIVAFDIYDNGGGEAPAIDVKYGGAEIATTKFAKADLVTGQFEDVRIELKRSGALTVLHKGVAIYQNLHLPGFAPLAGRFAMGARTGGENAHHWVDDLSFTTAVAVNTPPSITAHPQSRTVNEGEPVTFTVEFDGSAPVTFQWRSNGEPIAGATSPSYTIDRARFDQNGAKFTCVVSNGFGTATSNEATLTVVQDTEAPALVKARGTINFNEVIVTFSKPVSPATAQTVGNYSIPGLTVSSAVVNAADDRIVTLRTGNQTPGAEYTLTVSNVQDLYGNTIGAANTDTFKAWVLLPGFVLTEYYHDIAGTAVADLLASPKFPNSPDARVLRPAFDLINGYGDNYGSRTTGFLVPTASDWYELFTRSDDASQLFFTGTQQVPNVLTDTPVAREDGCCQAFLEPPAAQTSLDVYNLQAGQMYPVAFLQKEGGGGDWGQVAWRSFANAHIPAADLTPIPGANLATYWDITDSSIEFIQQPLTQTVVETRSTTLSVVVEVDENNAGSVFYQWLRNGTAIAGATTATYTTPVLQLADSGVRYSVRVEVPGLTQTSAEATITVIPDTFPPEIAGAGAMASRTGNTFDVGVLFDEPVSQATASVAGNYSVAGGTVSAVAFYPKSPGVVLTVSGLTVGNSYTVTVRNVADVKGNAIGEATHPFTVSPLKWGIVGGNELGLGNGVLPVGGASFDVYSDGIGEWATYDEATFVYEEITGDFDKKLRVEFQDNSSQWARAGLIARDVTNFGVNRAAQEGGQAGRYQKVHVNPVGPTLTGPGTLGNAQWEGNRRLLTGGATDSAGGGGTPQYPNAWCRMVREGQTLTIYRSDDGVNWIQLGSTTWPDAAGAEGQPLPATLFVGPEFSPENGNITNEGDRGVWLARIREYGDTQSADPGLLGIALVDGQVTLTWASGAVLQSATVVTGPFTDVAGASSPHTVTPTVGEMFFRLRSP